MNPENQKRKRWKNALIAIGLCIGFLAAFLLWAQDPWVMTQVFAIVFLFAMAVWALGKLVLFLVQKVVS